MAVERARPSPLASLPAGSCPPSLPAGGCPPSLNVSRNWPPSGCGLRSSISIRRSASLGTLFSLTPAVGKYANHLPFLIHTAQPRKLNVAAAWGSALSMTPIDLHLADWYSRAASPDPARPAKSLDDGALARLHSLHGEAGRKLELAQFVARVPAACVVLMLMGALALIWAAAAGGAGLKGSFAWAALVLLGIVAMIRLHIRGFARSLRRTPLAEAGSDLRLLLLFTGAVWGGGAFLIMPDQPAPALVFFFAAPD